MTPHPAEHVTVRDAVAADLPRVVELIGLGATRTGKEDGADLAAYETALAEIDATPRSRVLVAEVAGPAGPTVVGTLQVWAVRHVQEHGGLCAEVESMHVHPDQRGLGVGSVLLAAVVDAARAWGCYRIQLTSNEQRTDAHRFYAREGFTASHVGFKLLLR